MQRPLLVQPAAGGRISGGYLYNAKMAQHGAWELVDATPENLVRRLAELPRERLILMDSIWLTPEAAPTFLAARRSGARLGLMLHAFPSMIQATETGRPPPAQPSSFELDTIEALELIVLPGPHYRQVLSHSRAALVIAEPGVDDAWRAPPRPRTGACRLVSVGAVTSGKGFLDVLEALESLQGSGADYHWSVIGSLHADPAYAQALVRRAQALPRIEICGQLSPEATRQTVQRADLLVMPSYGENQPLVLLEALAASVPAVAYAAGATRHMLQHDVEGLIAPVGDRAALEAHLGRLLADEATRFSMATRCWQRQRSLSSWSAAARAASALLTEQLAGGGMPARSAAHGSRGDAP